MRWLWHGARNEAPLPRLAEVVECYRRARAALDLACVALEPAQPFESGPLDALACALCAESAYWSLLGHRISADAAASPRQPTSGTLPSPGFETLWAQSAPELLSKAAEDTATLDRLKHAVLGKSFVDFANLPRADQAALARDLRTFAEQLCKPLDSARTELERQWRRRLLRFLPLAMGLVLALACVLFALARADRLRNVAQGKPWTASSRYPEGGCVSPDQDCERGKRYFFHTLQESDPWLEIDLGTVQSISGLDVRNRTDCCPERALPLVVEVSVDHASFHEVARQTEEFLNWKPEFRPVQARWVKLRVPGVAILHLARVRVLR